MSNKPRSFGFLRPTGWARLAPFGRNQAYLASKRLRRAVRSRRTRTGAARVLPLTLRGQPVTQAVRMRDREHRPPDEVIRFKVFAPAEPIAIGGRGTASRRRGPDNQRRRRALPPRRIGGPSASDARKRSNWATVTSRVAIANERSSRTAWIRSSESRPSSSSGEPDLELERFRHGDDGHRHALGIDEPVSAGGGLSAPLHDSSSESSCRPRSHFVRKSQSIAE